MVAGIVFATSCGSGEDAVQTTTEAASTTSTSATTTTLPFRLTLEQQSLLVIEDSELPLGLRDLVPTPTGYQAGPAYFSEGPRLWVGRFLVPYSLEWLESQAVTEAIHAESLVSGTYLLPSTEEAQALFERGAAIVRDGGDIDDPTRDQLSFFDLDDIGDAAIGYTAHRRTEEGSWWETEVVFRSGSTLGHVRIARVEVGDDTGVLMNLAARLDEKIRAIARGDLEAPSHEGFVLHVAPSRQLETFAFEMMARIDTGLVFESVRASGEFTAPLSSSPHSPPARMRCEVGYIGSDHVTFFVDGDRVAAESGTGWAWLADDDPSKRLLTLCPGSPEFFDIGFTMSEYDLLVLDDQGVQLGPHDEVEQSGVDARRYTVPDPWGPFVYLFDLTEVTDMTYWFEATSGWPVRMTLAGLTRSGVEEFPVEIEFSISRPNSLGVALEIPYDLREADGDA